MDDILILIILILPSILLAILWWSHSKKESELNKKTIVLQSKIERSKLITPLKITAYERLIAMLERFKLFGLLMRNNNDAVGSSQLQLALINAIRNEFEMNVSMQMYVSNVAWKQIVKGKDQSLDSIKIAGVKAGIDSTALKLSQEVLRQEEEHGNKELQRAIEVLKHEINTTVING